MTRREIVASCLLIVVAVWMWSVLSESTNSTEDASPTINQPSNEQPQQQRRPVEQSASPNRSASIEVQAVTTLVDASSVRQDMLDEPLPPLPSDEFFDDGTPEILSGRAAALKQWQERNSELWGDLDRQVRSCVYTQYVNALGPSPEQAIDDCLAHYENADY